MAISEPEASSLLNGIIVEDFVDYRGNDPANRSDLGGWRSAFFVLGVEVAERFAFFGITLNLITYLTGPLGQPTASATKNVNVWYGTALLLPLLCGLIADWFLGRYRTIVISSITYILGLGLLTLLAVLPSDCQKNVSISNKESCAPPRFRIILIFFGLYLVAVAQGGHKPCIQAFGADQFGSQDAQEREAKSSFFNWWYFTIVAINTVAITILNYIQDNLGWGLGFGIPCIAVVLALIIFLLGTTTYRFTKRTNEKNSCSRIGLVFVRAFRNWRTPITSLGEETGGKSQKASQQFKFLNKALLVHDGTEEDVCQMSDVEDAKAILRLVPIWATSLIFAIVFAQGLTLFTEQAVTMERSIGPAFEIPAASIQSVTSISIIVSIPLYDRAFVPIARGITRKPSSITMLQRIGTGLLLSILAMVISALVEMKRLESALKYGLVDKPRETIPMSAGWLIPQYVLVGLADVFAYVGLQEFFYDQVPSGLRSVGLALNQSIFGVGSLLSGLLITIIQSATSGEGHDSWFSDNLNRAHLDYFYWLLSGLGLVAFIGFLCSAKSYTYRGN